MHQVPNRLRGSVACGSSARFQKNGLEGRSGRVPAAGVDLRVVFRGDAADGHLGVFPAYEPAVRAEGPIGSVEKGSPEGSAAPPPGALPASRITERGRRLASGHFLRSRSSRRNSASSRRRSSRSSRT
jgi:hypothetical protein